MVNDDAASSSTRTRKRAPSEGQARTTSWMRQRELEYRRVKGHLSCAECKRCAVLATLTISTLGSCFMLG